MTQVFDRRVLLERLMGDEELLREIIVLFLQEAPSQVEGLKRAVREGDEAEAARMAHTLKGSAANLAADAFRYLARQIEMAARSEPAALDPSMGVALDHEYLRLQSALRASLESGL